MRNKRYLTYGDVNIYPSYSTVKSRSNVTLQSRLTKHIDIDLPVISSPMDTVTGSSMAIEMTKHGAVGALHRDCTITQNVEMFKDVFPDRVDDEDTHKKNRENWNVISTIGATGDYLDRADALISNGANIILIDVAHGHHSHVRTAITELKMRYPDVEVIAGNIATPKAALDLSEWGADALRCGVGGGCFAAGTRVLMANGMYKNIEDIQEGDSVINKNGDPVKVKRAWKTGTKEVSKVRTNRWYGDTYVTPDHRFWRGHYGNLSENTVKNRGYKKSLRGYEWTPIGKFHGGISTFPKNISFDLNQTFSIDIEKRGEGIDVILEPSYDLGYIFGTFLGDGYSHTPKFENSNRGSVHWGFGKNEKRIASKLLDSIRSVFDSSSSGEPAIEETENMQKVHFYYKPFADFLRSFSKKQEKHLPEKFLVDNKHYLGGILDGLIDSDGSNAKDGRVCFYNTSKKLIELFNILNVLVNDKLPNSRKRKKSSGGLVGCNVENLNQPYHSRLSIQEHRRENNDYRFVKVLENKETDICVDVYDIEVEDDTHSFIANNSIVHNSVCSTRLKTGVGVPMITCIQDIVQALEENNHDVPVIADGGIKTAGDMAKAFAAGADTVMCGGLFSGTKETPGILQREGFFPNERLFKRYRGAASESAKIDNRGNAKNIEGVSRTVEYKGPVSRILTTVKEDLQSSFSYVGATTIDEFHSKSKLIEISNAGYVEGTPHF